MADYLETPFRTAYITEPGYNFSGLDRLVRGRIFLTTGGENNFKEVIENMRNALENFDPQKDLLVLTGRAALSFLLSWVLQSVHFTAGKDVLRIAIYRNKEYQVLDLDDPESWILVPYRSRRRPEERIQHD